MIAAGLAMVEKVHAKPQAVKNAKPQAAVALEQRPHNLFSMACVGRAPYRTES
jgi:hypothetical protein